MLLSRCAGGYFVRALLISLLVPSTNAAHAQPLAAFNVATYNLRLNLAQDGANAWPHRKEVVKALIRYHEWDLFGTQEGLPDQIDDLAGMDGFAFVGVGRDDGKRAGEHAAIFYRKSRFKVERHGDFWLSESPDKPSKGWDARCCNRLATWARMRDLNSERVFYVFSVHFDHEGVVARRESAHLMLRMIRKLAGDSPVICLGDFNATPESEPITIMAAALKEAYKISDTPAYGPVGTFNGFKLDAELADRIDYIFVNDRVRVLKYGVLTDTSGARFPSDHLPVVAKVVLR